MLHRKRNELSLQKILPTLHSLAEKSAPEAAGLYFNVSDLLPGEESAPVMLSPSITKYFGQKPSIIKSLATEHFSVTKKSLDISEYLCYTFAASTIPSTKTTF